MYKEEARHRGEEAQAEPLSPGERGWGEGWSDRAIVEHILAHNLHGIDLDPRAVQIAAAALWLKARRTCPDARPARLNLVASNLRLAALPEDDPALVELRLEVERETGIPAVLTDTLIQALSGADHLGSLLKIDAAVEEAIERHEAELNRRPPGQLHLALEPQAVGAAPVGAAPRRDSTADRAQTKADILERLETFLAHHTHGEDLGLRLHGEQLAAGVRFLRMLKEGAYHLVVGNPPYQGTSKMADADYVKRRYPLGKADLYAAFLLRGLQFARDAGISALLTMRNWMFIKQYAELRISLLDRFDLRALGDFAIGAFDEVPNDVLSVVVSIFRKVPPVEELSVALQPTSLDDRSYDRERTQRKRAAVSAGEGEYAFRVAGLAGIPEHPLVYWWGNELIITYLKSPLLGELAPAVEGVTTSDNQRFLRAVSELRDVNLDDKKSHWLPAVRGAEGRSWIEPLVEVINWRTKGLEIKNTVREGKPAASVRNEIYYMTRGVSFTSMGHDFRARAFRYDSIFESKGRSLFPSDLAAAVCCMNTSKSRFILQSLNPTVDFMPGDVNRLPFFSVDSSHLIFASVDEAFAKHESHREPSIEFKYPGPSPWRYAQSWAQEAVDRPEGAPLPPYEPEYDPAPPTDHLSFALGVALGRFGGGEGRGGEGIFDPATADLSHALPAGILFLDGTLDANERHDGLGHPAAEVLHTAWAEHGAAIDARSDLRTWLRLKFFKDVHKGMYESRPIHWPLSSERRTFVAWINIHRWDVRTLRVLLADHLNPALRRIEGELADLRAARDGADRRAAQTAEKRYDRVLRARDELSDFIAAVEQCAERGAPPADPKSPARESDARYEPDLDDGVMINSAALWPLLEPQWKDPKRWWNELSSGSGKKDNDWSHLAMRYWPTRVDAKCRQDPSLGVAHGCFWAYHPARAWAWELRLQDEIAPDFRIEEAPYRGDGGHDAHRAAYLADHPAEALAAVAKEALRRRRKQNAPQPELRILEPGLWTHHPAQCWQLELDLIEKQGAGFHLRAPDEPEARAAFEDANANLVAGREALLLALTPADDLLTGAEGEDEAESAPREEEDEVRSDETNQSLEETP